MVDDLSNSALFGQSQTLTFYLPLTVNCFKHRIPQQEAFCTIFLVFPGQYLNSRRFLHSMDLAYAAADLIVSRAGAMTCYEILATGKPAILIPSPNVAEGHQFKNASLMADVAGSRVIIEDELDSITLGMTIEEILGNEDLMAEMSERALKAAKPGASADIAQHILSLNESSQPKKSNKI